MIFAVDFDGTIVRNEFPKIGEELIVAMDGVKPTEVMIALQGQGDKIIIWTCRCGRYLVEAIQWLEERGVYPDGVNCNLIGTPGFGIPKIVADVYIDDKSFPPFTNWQDVYESFVVKKQKREPIIVHPYEAKINMTESRLTMLVREYTNYLQTYIDSALSKKDYLTDNEKFALAVVSGCKIEYSEITKTFRTVNPIGIVHDGTKWRVMERL